MCKSAQTFSNFGDTRIVSAAVRRCWSQLQHTGNCEQQTKLTFSAIFCAPCIVHHEPICVLKYEGKTETQGKDPLTQSDAKDGQVALSCQTLWVLTLAYD